jgi:hypothetical protein
MNENKLINFDDVYETDEDLRKAVETKWGHKLSDDQWMKSVAGGLQSWTALLGGNVSR